MSPDLTSFESLKSLATHLRDTLANKKFILVFAYNGTGKTRLSTAFKDLGKRNITADLTDEDVNSLSRSSQRTTHFSLMSCTMN
jgi:tRNA A37 threonylcarbamoyladenosine biosynthesis protein TsaE